MKLISLVFALLLQAVLCTAVSVARPNILFILTDDLGYHDLGCYGSSFYETPHIDRLAAQGLRFTGAYTAGSICSPTRASIQTGKYPPRTGITDWIPGARPPGKPLIEPPNASALSHDEFTIGEAMRAAGYQTFYAGKWHLGGANHQPDSMGYEVYVSDEQLGDFRRDPSVGRRISESAIHFFDTRDAGRPFFAFLSYHEPHTPILEYPDFIEKFRHKKGALPDGAKPEGIPEHDGLTRAHQNMPAYGSEVAGLDAWVGMVLDAIDERGLAEETIVVFTSDNGGLATKATPGPTSNAPLRASKGWLYEGGVKVPLIVRMPGVTTAGSVTDSRVISNDFYPTFLEMAGAPLRPEQHLDGHSFLPAIKASEATIDRGPLFWHYPHYHGSTWAPGAAMLDGDWKLIEFYHYKTVELYNLATDPEEDNNLAESEPERVRSMLATLHAWQKQVGALMPRPRTSSDQ